MKKLAIITGFGALAEQVEVLARQSNVAHVQYTIRPWLPLLSRPFTPMNAAHVHLGSLQPFRFAEIVERLRRDEVDRVFLIGGFPYDRFLQLSIRHMLGDIVVNADDICRQYYYGVSEKLSEPAQYFKALERLMIGNDIEVLASRDIFPELNIPPGWSAGSAVPAAVIHMLPAILRVLTNPARRAPSEQIRPSQAVIADPCLAQNDGIACQERSGTDELIRRYGRLHSEKETPFLFKVPSMEFNCAFDEPTIGPRTIDECGTAGIKGIVICSSATRVANRTETQRLIESNGMFFYDLPLTELTRYVGHDLTDLPG